MAERCTRLGRLSTGNAIRAGGVDQRGCKPGAANPAHQVRRHRLSRAALPSTNPGLGLPASHGELSFSPAGVRVMVFFYPHPDWFGIGADAAAPAAKDGSTSSSALTDADP